MAGGDVEWPPLCWCWGAGAGACSFPVLTGRCLQLLKKMSSSDTPLGTVALLQEKQKAQKTPYIVLSGSGKSMNAYVRVGWPAARAVWGWEVAPFCSLTPVFSLQEHHHQVTPASLPILSPTLILNKVPSLFFPPWSWCRFQGQTWEERQAVLGEASAPPPSGHVTVRPQPSHCTSLSLFAIIHSFT